MRKVMAILLVLLLLSGLGYLVAGIIKTNKFKNEATAKTQLLPTLDFKQLSGKRFGNDSLPAGQPTVVYYYSPDCEHCQYEAGEIQKNLAQFQRATLVMVSTADSAAVAKFAAQYGLAKQPNIHFLLDSKGAFYKTFGTALVPSFFVYNGQHELVQKFAGETKIDAITKLIQ
jgi:peroxiredoxin